MRKPLLPLAFLALALVARPAHAYLDPASGSMMLQIVLGGLAGAAVGVKLFWRKLRGAFSRRGPVDGESPEQPGGV